LKKLRDFYPLSLDSSATFSDQHALVLSTDEMPDGFLKELLKKFPFGQGYGEAEGLGEADEDDAEYAIYEQADDEDDD